MGFASHKISTGTLRKLIDKAGYNLSEFARELDISKEALRSYTSRKVVAAPIKPETLRAIAEKLRVDPSVLRVPDASESGDAVLRLPAELLAALEIVAKDNKRTVIEELQAHVDSFRFRVSQPTEPDQSRHREAHAADR